jgi:sec-independent protein translocase protein TatA
VPFGLGIWEIVILAVVLVLLFGSKGLPSMARRLGTGIREVKDAVEEIDPRTALDPKKAEPAKAPAKQLPDAEVVPAAAAQPAEAVEQAEAVESQPPPAAGV